MMNDKNNNNMILCTESYKESPTQEGASAFAGKLDHPDSKYYKHNDFYNMKSDENLHILSHFKTYQQTTEYTCGPSCILMMLNWFGVDNYHERYIAEVVKSVPKHGTTMQNIVMFFKSLGWNVDSHASQETKFRSVEEFEKFVIKHIDNSLPIMVNWVDWAGHYQVIVGIDTCGTDSPYDDVLILADPYDVTDHMQDGYYVFPLGRFYEMWFEGPCANRVTPYKQPYIVAYPKV